MIKFDCLNKTTVRCCDSGGHSSSTHSRARLTRCMCDVTARGNEGPFSSVLMQTWSADMSRALVCVLMDAWSLGSNGQTVHQPTPDVQTVEGETVTLECRYDRLPTNDYIFWYKQEANAAPEFMLSRLKLDQGKTEEKYAKRFHCRVNASTSQAPLHIDNVKPSDSGVFYCALQPCVAVGFKVVFGGGTRVIVERRKEFKPSFYKMESRNLSACLATGFSRHNATAKAGKGYMFEQSRPVLISDDSLYNQVALLSHNDMCGEGDSGPGRCPDALGPDKTVNLLSLAVLALRLVFVKTLAINGVMTLRLCFGALE
ncbi:T cell receptor alpha chain MC.7.G5-like isoform X1 [Syngnathus acus]|uniref:T cell receptor alpha chain MC.7.G5-like isoform X1 n=1 Tax=Syngnathus acus TaxID=161584 RepID=UPI001885C767|nr:T cell receptor alpha chain MC.7.G5-like isoform X1 [Syngnathus acus]XP_037098990.1 T cell receptor alpha chain MC.7.G5-like isoform X1 [Syngnathus acus]